MYRLLFFALLIYTVSAESCIIQDKKGKPDIRVIELDDSSSDSDSESEVIALHLPDRRRREIIEIRNQEGGKNFCKDDDDCGPGSICVAHLTCVKGTKRTVDTLKANAAN
ncbi:PREDICTED: uncharacterized protein LOC105451837 [Wasmannia auropunctata]|uniref:uncharacterized protein LOC105451837 n=1 Tax=Wasmannia auropunctata TaxID=64793 RepID=UPI0005EFD6E1|nr:PREDICTED: uncharacterized protein LOC105451837 [Wasmannia auropunctata]